MTNVLLLWRLTGYFLIFLNSALMLYFIRKHFSHSPVSQERVLYAFFFVLGAADCELMVSLVCKLSAKLLHSWLRDAYPPHHSLPSLVIWLLFQLSGRICIQVGTLVRLQGMELVVVRQHLYHFGLVCISSWLVDGHCSRHFRTKHQGSSKSKSQQKAEGTVMW